MTDRIYESADVMGILLVDHIIIGDGKYKSVFTNQKMNKYQIEK